MLRIPLFSGMYMGEVVRQVLWDLMAEGLISDYEDDEDLSDAEERSRA